MAEKEERILVGIQREDGSRTHFEKGFGVFSRKEVVERIAKALCADDVMREGYYQMAEAALNALLGVEK